MSLSTFGAILRFAIELEKDAAAYYEREGAAGAQAEVVASLARVHRKRQQLAERTRRELVTEMILEPIYGLQEEDWRVDLSTPGWQNAPELERRVRGFYATAADKVSIPQVARTFRKVADEGARLEEQAGGLL